jgi:hypothetical protein
VKGDTPARVEGITHPGLADVGEAEEVTTVVLQCCYSIVTLLLQGSYTVVAVSLQCCHSAVRVLLQYCYRVATVLLQCWYSGLW